MKNIILPLCLLFCIACVKGTVIKTKPEASKVMKLDETEAEKLKLLSCQIDTTKTFTNFIWKKGNGELCKADDNAKSCTITDKPYVAKDDPKYDLYATTKVTFEHAGSYSCELTDTTTSFNAEGPFTGDVTVVETPKCGEAVSIVEGTKNQDVSCSMKYKGTTVPVLKMTVGTDKTEVVTGKEGDKETETDAIPITATHTIPATEPVGEKTYTCTASNVDAVTPTNCTTKVTVTSIIGTKPADKVARIGDKNVKMTCTVAKSATGYETFTWTKGDIKCVGKETGESDKCTGTDNDNYKLDPAAKHDLNIIEVKDASAGEYTCTVKTPAKTENASLIPITAESPECSKSDKKLICKVTYKGEKEPTVQWHKDDEDTKITSKSEGGVVTVEVEPADGEDDKYACKVMNGEEKVYECKAEDVDSGAPSLDARIYYSTLFSVAVVWLWHQLN